MVIQSRPIQPSTEKTNTKESRKAGSLLLALDVWSSFSGAIVSLEAGGISLSLSRRLVTPETRNDHLEIQEDTDNRDGWRCM
jgi:hypothetical protein